jgi:alanyl-tRNA synthetase
MKGRMNRAPDSCGRVWLKQVRTRRNYRPRQPPKEAVNRARASLRHLGHQAISPTDSMHYVVTDTLRTLAHSLGDGVDTKEAGKGYLVARIAGMNPSRRNSRNRLQMSFSCS